MKLYQYDHCPFCVRADMVANYKRVPHEKVYLLNDDEATCFRLIGTKMVPILAFDDGTAMGESLDIVARFDALGDPAKILRPQTACSSDLLPLIDSASEAINCLLFPRNINPLLDQPEFATQSARDYFQRKKEAIIQRSFTQALEETAEHQAVVEKMLGELQALPNPAAHNQTLGLDDVLLYPTLRNLTMVKGLHFPDRVHSYILAIAALTKTQTYFDRAC